MSFPPLSRTADQLLVAVGDPDVDIDRMAEIIDQDPGLAARVLGLANSAYFGQARAINRVREAIIRVLGLNMVKSLALSISMAGAFDTDACRSFNLEAYWYNSLGSAMLARNIASRIAQEAPVDAESVYLCGLLHNLGMLLLAHAVPGQLSGVLEEYRQNPEADLCRLEQQAIGIDHVEAGELLVRRWHLPEAVSEVIGHFCDPDYDGDYRIHRETVIAASRWVSSDFAGESTALSACSGLLAIPGLGGGVLDRLEEQFHGQRDELRAIARILT